MNLRSLRYRKDFISSDLDAGLCLLLKICPNLTSICSDSTCDDISFHAIAYLREYAMGDKEKELSSEVVATRGGCCEWQRLIDRVTAEVACDVAERQDWDKIRFRKGNAVLNVQILNYY